MSDESYLEKDIKDPHDHDVLSGRGNFVNYHPGNEFFRELVRKHKLAYVQCPKPQKGKFSKLIYDEVRARNPPGRYLKQDTKTKLWYDIGERKALDKTRQALREGAPEIMKELSGDEMDPTDTPSPRPPFSASVSLGGSSHHATGLGGSSHHGRPVSVHVQRSCQDLDFYYRLGCIRVAHPFIFRCRHRRHQVSPPASVHLRSLICRKASHSSNL